MNYTVTRRGFLLCSLFLILQFLTLYLIWGDIFIDHSSKTSCMEWAENPSYYMWIYEHFSLVYYFMFIKTQLTFATHSLHHQYHKVLLQFLAVTSFLYYFRITQYCHPLCHLTILPSLDHLQLYGVGQIVAQVLQWLLSTDDLSPFLCFILFTTYNSEDCHSQTSITFLWGETSHFGNQTGYTDCLLSTRSVSEAWTSKRLPISSASLPLQKPYSLFPVNCIKYSFSSFFSKHCRKIKQFLISSRNDCCLEFLKLEVHVYWGRTDWEGCKIMY